MSLWNDIKNAANPFKNNLDPGTALIGNVLGLHNTYATTMPGGLTPWNAWKNVKQDWSTFKHWVVPDTRRDRELMVNTSQGSRRLVYGKVRVSGQIVFAETSNGSATLHLVIVLAGHPCTLATRTEGGIEKDDIYLDEKKIETLVSQGIVTYTYYDGTQTTADAGLIAACPSWTSDHKLLGCSYLILNLTYAENAWPSGIPTPKVVLKGFKVYDPRDESTAWSDNPALCIRHYMLLPVADGGMGCASSEVDDDSVIAAADICDESVVSDDIGGTEKRYTCNGTVTLEQTPAAILSRMIDGMAGRYNYIQGKWQIFAGAYSTPRSEPLDESYLNGNIKINIGANKNSLLNTVKGSFVDPGNQWAVTDFPVVTIPAYVDDDGEELDGSLQLDFTTSPTMAQRLGKLTLERSRRGTTVEYPCNLKAFDVAYNDVVKVNNALMGWSERIFRVIDWQGGVTGGIVLTLQEEDENIYDWVVGDISPVIPPDPTTLLDPWGYGPFYVSDFSGVEAIPPESTNPTTQPVINVINASIGLLSVTANVIAGHAVNVSGSFIINNTGEDDWAVIFGLFRDSTRIHFSGYGITVKGGTKVSIPYHFKDVPDTSGSVTYVLRVPHQLTANVLKYNDISLNATGR